MTSARKSASRTAGVDVPPRPPVPMGTAADAPHGSRPEQVYSRLRDLIMTIAERIGRAEDAELVVLVDAVPAVGADQVDHQRLAGR